MFAHPRESFYMIIEHKHETMSTIIHDADLDADNDLDAHRQVKQWIERNHNKYVKLLKCQHIGEYAYNTVLFPEDYKQGECKILENPDPQ